MPPPRNSRKEISSPERQTKPPESQTQPPPSSKHSANISASSSSSSDADNFSSPPPMEPFVFPPGFKFVPTDEDLIFHYLKPFLEGNENPFPNVQIHRVNIYESNPEQLSKEYEKGNDKEWFFITERTKKREGGKMQNRSDNGGSWRTLNVAKKIKAGQGVVGYKTALDYRISVQGKSVKSDWLMQEYWVESNGDNNKVDHALCKIFLTPRVQKRKAKEEEKERKKKKKEAVEEEVGQPRNAAFQQLQFCVPSLDACQPHQSLIQQQQSHDDYAYKQQQHNVATVVDVEALNEEIDQPCNAAFQQLQFCVPPLDPCQPHQSLIQRKQLHNVATVIDVKALKEELFDQPCSAAFQQLPFCAPPLDLCQPHHSLIQQKQLHNVATVVDVKALKEEVDQPCNAAFQQPQFYVPQLDQCQLYQSQLQQQQPHYYAYQPQPQLLHNVANQPHQPQIFLVPLDSLQLQAQEQHQFPFLDLSDELQELINFIQRPVIPDDAALYQDGDEKSSISGSLEEIVREGMKKH